MSKLSIKPTFKTKITKLENGCIVGLSNKELPNGTEIFVFGSNESGIHGAGAARYAMDKLGAEYGIGFGYSGTTFAIPTKDFEIESLSIDRVKDYIDSFIQLSNLRPRWNFKVTRIGCGLAGFKDEDIAPLFKDCGENCSFDEAWKPWLGEGKNYWGTFG